MTPLWTSAEIEAATGGVASAPFEVSGVTFDSREAGPGDLFVAMPGTASDDMAINPYNMPLIFLIMPAKVTRHNIG